MDEFRPLRAALQRDDTILFVGSGVSAWSGLPGWSQLVEELARFLDESGSSAELVRKELERHDLLQAASYGLDLLTKSQFREFVRKSCRVGTAELHEIHKIIVSLGPTCYVTTNYDQLIEGALRKFRPGEYFQIVTNRQITETADIIQARAHHFVFKPHGDVADAESVVLSREQYRSLLGDRAQVLRAIETLLVSRPVLFLGFGLRDPDFLYVRDLIANTYRGGTVDHYALMPDVSSLERDYWRRNYGIHIFSYPTSLRPDGGNDHSELLQILRGLVPRHEPAALEVDHVPEDQSVQQGDAEFTLALVRYCARIESQMIPSVTEIPLTISSDLRPRLSREALYETRTVPADQFFSGVQRGVLVGTPGAGKSYIQRGHLRQECARIHALCIEGSAAATSVELPIYLDLKLYGGSLWTMAEEALPSGVDLASVLAQVRVRFLIDSFNEIKREYLDDGTALKDLDGFLRLVGSSTVTIASRSTEGLDHLDWPVFRIDAIERSFLLKEISDAGLNVKDTLLFEEALGLLQKPLFYRFWKDGAVQLGAGLHPTELYGSLFDQLGREYQKASGKPVDLADVLAPVAYSALNSGDETLPLTTIVAISKRSSRHSFDPDHLIDWLIVRGVLIPAPGSRLTFFHQSVTEFLAATQLARVYVAAPEILTDVLGYRRWDHALFLAASLLPPVSANAFVESVLDADLRLAVRAVGYLEYNAEELVRTVLREVVRRDLPPHQMLDLAWEIEHLPAHFVDVADLKGLIGKGNALAGAALRLLTRFQGASAKTVLLDTLVESPNDFNMLSGVGYALKDIVSAEDLPDILLRIERICTAGIEDFDALSNALGTALSRLDLRSVFAPFSELRNTSKLYTAILADILMSSSDPVAFDLCLSLVDQGEPAFVFPLLMRCGSPSTRKSASFAQFTSKHVDVLMTTLDSAEHGRWALELLHSLFHARPELRVRPPAEDASLKSVALLYACGDLDSFWLRLADMAERPVHLVEQEPLWLLEGVEEVNWIGHSDVLLRLLGMRSARLAKHLLNSVVEYRHGSVGSIHIAHPESWVSWMLEIPSTGEGFWTKHRFAEFLIRFAGSEFREWVVSELGNTESAFREFLADFIVGHLDQLSTNQLSAAAISFLLVDLKRPSGFDSPLGMLATEEFVEDRLLPALNRATSDVERRRLLFVIDQAGQRHARRYILDREGLIP